MKNSMLHFSSFLDAGTTAAERVRPWRHPSVTDDTVAASSSANDPHLHQIDLTAADFSSTYQKSPESMDEYATTTTTTTTKSEGHTSRANVRDVVPTDLNVSRL